MDVRYDIVSDCLALVRQCDMPIKKKLHLETLLYQMKRLLLKSKKTAMAGDACCVQPFRELLEMVHSACSENYQQDVLTNVTDRIDLLMARLDTRNTPCDSGRL